MARRPALRPRPVALARSADDAGERLEGAAARPVVVPETIVMDREERQAHHRAFVTVRTSAIDTLAANVRTPMIARRQRTTARPSLIYGGPAAAGKTTALLHIGRACHLAHTRRVPAPPGQAHPRVPAAYVLVPSGATAKALAVECARHLGVSPSRPG